jgi:hypothetical protein
MRVKINTKMSRRKLLKKLDVTEACDATFWCLFLHAFFLMSRKSNLVPNSVKTFNPNKQLCRSNIEINSEKIILLINISWSKTVQFGERNLVVPLISIPPKILFISITTPISVKLD